MKYDQAGQALSPVHFIWRASNKKPPASADALISSEQQKF